MQCWFCEASSYQLLFTTPSCRTWDPTTDLAGCSGGRVVRGPHNTVSDGPFLESKDLVLGFIVVKARDLAQAVELAKGCPMLAGGGSVEVRPIGTLPG